MRAKIEKTRDYVWKSYCFGSHYAYAWANGWKIVEETSGKVLESSVSYGGCNVRAAVMRFTRRKDAAAWVAGFNGEPCLETYDSEQRSEWREGVYSREHEEKRAARKAS